jgi:anti-sigma factor RsiW
MNCAEAEPRLALRLYDGDSDPALEEHLAACPACRDAVRAMDDVRAAYAASRAEQQPAAVRARALALAPRSRLPALAGLAASLLVGVALVALSVFDRVAPVVPAASTAPADADPELGGLIDETRRRLDALEAPAPAPSALDRDIESLTSALDRLERSLDPFGGTP